MLKFLLLLQALMVVLLRYLIPNLFIFLTFQVGAVRQKPLVRMANLDDEMSISMDGTTDEEVSDEDDVDMPLSAPLRNHKENNRFVFYLMNSRCSSKTSIISEVNFFSDHVPL